MNLIIVFAFCILTKFLSAGANEPRGSRNIACLSNTRVIITCAMPESDSLYIDWYFYSRDRFRSTPQLLTNNTGSNVSTNYLMIKIKNEECLVIDSVQLRDSGIYYCGTVNATGEASTEVGSHLTVFASDPTCDVKNFTVMENDYILLQCTVMYDGLWRPTMEWTQLGFLGQAKINNENILVNVTESQQNVSMTASLQILAKPYHNDVSFVCKTYFDYRDMSMKKKVSDNTPEYKYVWESPKISVLYGTRNVSIYPASDIFYPGDKLSCSAFGNPQPQYQWIDNETVFYVGWQIEIVQSMIRSEPYVLRCKAHNTVSESFSDITFTVQSRFPPIYFAIVAVWLLCTLLLIGIIYAIRRCAKDRNERSYAVYYNSRDGQNDPNGHIVRNEGIGALNEDRHGNYIDLLGDQPRNEARNLSGTPAVARNCADNNEETESKFAGADGTQYVQMNIRPENIASSSRPVVHRSRIQVSNYASIDHTRKAPKPRK